MWTFLSNRHHLVSLLGLGEAVLFTPAHKEGEMIIFQSIDCSLSITHPSCIHPTHIPTCREYRDEGTGAFKGLVFVKRKDGRGTAVVGGFVEIGK